MFQLYNCALIFNSFYIMQQAFCSWYSFVKISLYLTIYWMPSFILALSILTYASRLHTDVCPLVCTLTHTSRFARWRMLSRLHTDALHTDACPLVCILMHAHLCTLITDACSLVSTLTYALTFVHWSLMRALSFAHWRMLSLLYTDHWCVLARLHTDAFAYWCMLACCTLVYASRLHTDACLISNLAL